METYHTESGFQIGKRRGTSVVEIEHFALLRVIRRGWPLSENQFTTSYTVLGAWRYTIGRVNSRFSRGKVPPLLR
jgi:hypothetical protein